MDCKPALEPNRDHLDRLRQFGYTEQEARFLYLAATHSGYFTRHQFLAFTHQTKGCLVHRFTTKLLTQHQAQATQYGHKTYVFKLTSRKIFDLIGKQNLRDHRSHTADFIRTRLLVLDLQSLLPGDEDPGLLVAEFFRTGAEQGYWRCRSASISRADEDGTPVPEVAA